MNFFRIPFLSVGTLDVLDPVYSFWNGPCWVSEQRQGRDPISDRVLGTKNCLNRDRFSRNGSMNYRPKHPLVIGRVEIPQNSSTTSRHEPRSTDDDGTVSLLSQRAAICHVNFESAQSHTGWIYDFWIEIFPENAHNLRKGLYSRFKAIFSLFKMGRMKKIHGKNSEKWGKSLKII